MLRNYYRMGVRMIALTWNYENGIGFPNLSINDNPKAPINNQAELANILGITDIFSLSSLSLDRDGIIDQ